MRHQKRGRKLGRNRNHRLALLRNLSCNLIEHERVTTTVAKAKELRPFIERLVTIARRGDLHSRRLVIARLGNQKGAAKKLVDEIAPRFVNRPGGYTRILKTAKRRLGDAAPTAIIEFLSADEQVASREPAKPVTPAVAAE
jgi:large subunit ribosomal protein L17